MDKSQKHYTKWKKPDTKDYITIWFHVYEILEKAKYERYICQNFQIIQFKLVNFIACKLSFNKADFF